MQTIQLVLSDASYAKKLKQLLCDNGNWPVTIKDGPSFQKGGVVVLDDKVLASLASAPDFPDRVVLVTHNDPEILSHAWDLGIRSVVYNTDTPSTVLLAIMSAYLRLPKLPQTAHRRVISPNAPSQLHKIAPHTLTGRHE
jgi:DNA-binding NarL/FixJ family response regulator